MIITETEDEMPPPRPTLWQRIRASWTVWLGIAVTAIGSVLDVITALAPILSGDDLQQAIRSFAGPYTSIVLQVLGALIIVCRMRGLIKEIKP